MRPTLTAEQLDAVQASGNVLLMAGAGTGKTSTLVERCLARILDPADPVSLDAVLMVTFTEAAAGEMRQRLRARLEERLDSEPTQPWLAEQLARVETARICTLHSFCLGLVRDHFHELGLDPELGVLPQDKADVLAAEKLEEVLRARLSDVGPSGAAVQSLLLEYARGREDRVRAWVLRLHHYTQTLADAPGWFEHQATEWARTEAVRWREWLCRGLDEWRALWLPELLHQPSDNAKAHACARLLADLPEAPERGAWAAAVSAIVAMDADWPRGTKGRHRGPLEKFFAEAAFLESVVIGGGERDPLDEDWNWVRGPMGALVELTREFGELYANAKRELAVVDFHDLEQYALRLLWDRTLDGPTPLAVRWQQALRHILVDEMQDINPAQDRILRALSRGGEAANRFLVGDVKQSIYRFRLADPRIFQGYARAWAAAGPSARVLALTGNFRSRPPILAFVNRLFADLLRPEVGGIAYTEDQWLRPGAADGASVAPPDPQPVVELRWIIEPPRGKAANVGTGAAADEGRSRVDPEREPEAARSGEIDDASATEREARLVAWRIQGLMAEGRRVVDRTTGVARPLGWGDVAVLLRSPRTRAETYARAFAALGIPLQAGRGGFYDSLAVSDLVSLLQILDNPLQDIPLLAVLRSPLAGFTPSDLVCLRVAGRKATLWRALKRLHRMGARFDPGSARGDAFPPGAAAAQRDPEGDRETNAWLRSAWPGAWEKADAFLACYGRWRQLVRLTSLSECLETVLEESGYEAWLSAQPACEPALNRVGRLLALTRQFDQFQRQGLHRFIRFVEARREVEVDVEPVAETAAGAVRLLSVHQSKGLEFPVVVLADLGKQFNFEDLRESVILDEHHGLCPMVQPPGDAPRYASLAHWLASRRQRREALGEELRLLYVACTRARELLILLGTTSTAAVEERWPAAGVGISVRTLLGANRWLDWLGPWWFGGAADRAEPGWTSILHQPGDSPLPAATGEPSEPGSSETGRSSLPRAECLPQIAARLRHVYPHGPATQESAKASVSQLRLRARQAADEEARPLFIGAVGTGPLASGIDAAARGTAHHLVLEALPLDHRITQGRLLETVHGLRGRGALSAAEVEALDLPALLAFWQSELGVRIQGEHAAVQRELPFTSRFAAEDLRGLGVPVASGLAPSEFLVVQGVIDLAVLGTAGIWLVDFKTDRVFEGDLEEHVRRYRPQLALYACALERIYRRPVTECWLHFLELRRSVPVPAGGRL